MKNSYLFLMTSKDEVSALGIIDIKTASQLENY